MTWLRIAVGVLIAVAIGVALVPLAVLADLKDGGTGWGLCPQGLDACRSSYFAGFELVAALFLVLAVVLTIIRLCVRLLRRIERKRAARAYLARQREVLARHQAVLAEQQTLRRTPPPGTGPTAASQVTPAGFPQPR